MKLLTYLFGWIGTLNRDPHTGRISHTRFWANVAYATATGCVVFQASKATLGAEMLLVYLACVGASTTASKFVSLRYGKPEPKESLDA